MKDIFIFLPQITFSCSVNDEKDIDFWLLFDDLCGDNTGLLWGTIGLNNDSLDDSSWDLHDGNLHNDDDLCGDDLRGDDLCGDNLRGDDLCGDDLHEDDLCGDDL